MWLQAHKLPTDGDYPGLAASPCGPLSRFGLGRECRAGEELHLYVTWTLRCLEDFKPPKDLGDLTDLLAHVFRTHVGLEGTTSLARMIQGGLVGAVASKAMQISFATR